MTKTEKPLKYKEKTREIAASEENMNSDSATITFIITVALVALGVLFSLVVGFIVYVIYEGKTTRAGAEARMAALQDAMGQMPADTVTPSLAQIWLSKHRENYEYFLMITRQLKLTFALALMSAVFGLLLFAITVCIALAFQEKLLVALIPAISAAIVEMFSGIILSVHRATLKQVSKLSDEAEREEQLYSTIMLSSSLSPQSKDAVISEILKNETESLIAADSENSMKK